MPYTLFQGGPASAQARLAAARALALRDRRRRAPRARLLLFLGETPLVGPARPRAGRAAGGRPTPDRAAAARGRRPPRWPAAGRRSRRSRCASTTRATACSLRFKRPPRSGLLFDLDTGRVLWRRDPTRVLPIASLTKMMTALVVAERVPRAARRCGSPRRRCATQRLGASGCCRAASGSASTRCSTGCCCPRATTPRSRSPSAPRGTVPRFVRLMNRKARAMGLDVHALLVARRLQGPRQPLLRGRPRGDRARGAARAAAGADRRAAARRCCRSRSRAASSSSTTTTRCCATGYRGTTGRQDRLHRRGGPLPGGDARGAAASRLGVVLLHSPDPGRPGAQAARPRVRARQTLAG